MYGGIICTYIHWRSEKRLAETVVAKPIFAQRGKKKKKNQPNGFKKKRRKERNAARVRLNYVCMYICT